MGPCGAAALSRGRTTQAWKLRAPTQYAGESGQKTGYRIWSTEVLPSTKGDFVPAGRAAQLKVLG